MKLITKPTVELVASTKTDGAAIGRWLDKNGTEWPTLDGMPEWDGESAVEAAGRCCYWSYRKGRPTKEWFENVVGEGHYSVLRHSSYTFAVSGVSRSLLQQLARHHHLDPSVLSQRFVDQGDDNVDIGLVIPPAMLKMHELWEEEGASEEHAEPSKQPMIRAFCRWVQAARASCDEYARIRSFLIESGLSRKEAGEAARSVLPECMETRFFLSGNGEAFLWYLRKRLPEGVDMEHRRLARAMATKLKEASPNIFASIAVD